jgi:hypothetical protein
MYRIQQQAVSILIKLEINSTLINNFILTVNSVSNIVRAYIIFFQLRYSYMRWLHSNICVVIFDPNTLIA